MISICSSVIWRAADGELNGPVSFGGFVLPVELLHFDVELLEDGYVASWITATETENDYFSLEASSDGKEWNQVAMIFGAGYSNVEQAYSVDLPTLEGEPRFFRLHQTDFDGSKELLAIDELVIAMHESSLNALVWPNPASRAINVAVQNVGDEEAEVLLFNARGEQVRSYLTNSSTRVLTIERGELPSGVYTLLINGRYATERTKLILN